MKSILLATASVLAFAGAAAADHTDENTPDGVSLGGTGTFGYSEAEDGFFSEGDIGFVLAQELNNGLVVAFTFGLGFSDQGENDFGNDFSVGDDFVLSLTDRSGDTGIHFGNTLFAAETHWDGVGDMESDGFSEQSDETVLRGDGAFGGIDASVSYVLADSDGDSPDADDPEDRANEVASSTSDIDQLSLGMTGTFGSFNVKAAYQEESEAVNRSQQPQDDPNSDVDDRDEDNSRNGVYDSDSDDDFNTDQVFAIRAGSTFAGADVAVGYAMNMGTGDEVDTSSLGVEGSVPFGPVTLGAYYVFEMSEADDDVATEPDESDPEDNYGVSAAYESGAIAAEIFYESDQGEDETGVIASYDFGNGLAVEAGLSTEDDNFILATYDLGQGAELFASFGEVDDAGPDDLEEGVAVGVSFEF